MGEPEAVEAEVGDMEATSGSDARSRQRCATILDRSTADITQRAAKLPGMRLIERPARRARKRPGPKESSIPGRQPTAYPMRPRPNVSHTIAASVWRLGRETASINGDALADAVRCERGRGAHNPAAKCPRSALAPRPRSPVRWDTVSPVSRQSASPLRRKQPATMGSKSNLSGIHPSRLRPCLPPRRRAQRPPSSLSSGSSPPTGTPRRPVGCAGSSCRARTFTPAWLAVGIFRYGSVPCPTRGRLALCPPFLLRRAASIELSRSPAVHCHYPPIRTR